MLPKAKMERINQLAKISKTRELTIEEKKEQELLRKEYIEVFREAFKKQLDTIEIVD